MKPVEDSIAADIEAAAAEVTAKAPPEPVVASEPVKTDPTTSESSEAKAARERDDKGRFAAKAKEDAKAAEAKTVKPTEPVKAIDPTPAPAVVAPPPPKPTRKPPQSWKPDVRELFATLPESVQEEAERLDREVRETMQKAAPARKFHEELQPLLTQHAPLLGNQPAQALKGMLETAHALKFGSPQQKAQILYEFMQDYGVGPELLNPFLEGKAQPAQPRQVDPQAIARQVREEMEREQSAKQSQALQAQVDEFMDANDFARDIEADMLAAITTKRAKDLPSAYAYALRLHELDDASPVGKVVRQRKEAAARTAAAASAATPANVSVKSAPSGVTAPPKRGGSIEDDIRAAHAEISGR